MAVILIHGASLGAWCWFRTIPLLRDRGLDVVAPDLPGHGKDDAIWSEITFADLVDRTVEVLDAQDQPSILVGHSLGGAVVTQAAELRPDAVRRLVYLTASVPADGQSARESTMTGTPEEIAAELHEARATSALHFDQMPPAALRGYFYGTCDDEHVELARTLLVPLLNSVVMEPLHLTADGFGRVPKAFIECLQDAAVPIAIQRAMQVRAGIELVRTLDTDHSPFFCDPAGLVDALVEIIAES